jgi:hypothetical protein
LPVECKQSVIDAARREHQAVHVEHRLIGKAELPVIALARPSGALAPSRRTKTECRFSQDLRGLSCDRRLQPPLGESNSLASRHIRRLRMIR